MTVARSGVHGVINRNFGAPGVTVLDSPALEGIGIAREMSHRSVGAVQQWSQV